MPITASTILGLAQILAVGLVLATLAITWITLRTLRNPPRRTYAWATARNRPGVPTELDPPRPFTEREFDTSAGAVHAWQIPGDDPEGPIIIVCPGWGDSCLGALPRLGALLPHARLVVPFDPPGHGDTPERTGKTTLGINEPAIINDIARTLAREENDAPVVLFGWSLGAGASIAAAAKAEGVRIAGVIAEAPYDLAPTPARNVVRLSGLPWRINIPLTYFILAKRLGEGLTPGRFSRRTHAAKLPNTVPLLVLHGSTDAVSPLQDGRAIADAAPNATLAIVDGAGHNNLWTDPRHEPASREAVESFFRSL
ncbi:MAG: alpha/beta hydrolase [Planctomycetota bacterium]